MAGNVCTVQLIDGDSIETIARAIHERWRAEQLAAGKPAPAWSDLDESRQASNRDQAADIAVKLAGIGCEIVPLRGHDAAECRFTDGEIEQLASAEHDRWVQERSNAGWTLGDKDVERKTTPYLVPFAELPDDIAEYDRMFVREIPVLLASVGLRAVRG
jgi:hypothetical protein